MSRTGYFCIRAAFDPNPQDFNSYVVGDCLCPDNFTGGECQPGYYCPEGSNGTVPFCLSVGCVSFA